MRTTLVRYVQGWVERRLGAPADHLRRVGEASFGGFLKLLLFLPLAAHRERTKALYVDAARLVATQREDCGSCLQMAIDEASRNGMPHELLAAILGRDLTSMHLVDRRLVLVVRFADGVLSRDGSDVEPRAAIEEHLGEHALAELSLAIASARVFPTLKRGLGVAASCSAVRLPALEAGARVR